MRGKADTCQSEERERDLARTSRAKLILALSPRLISHSNERRGEEALAKAATTAPRVVLFAPFKVNPLPSPPPPRQIASDFTKQSFKCAKPRFERFFFSILNDREKKIQLMSIRILKRTIGESLFKIFREPNVFVSTIRYFYGGGGKEFIREIRYYEVYFFKRWL